MQTFENWKSIQKKTRSYLFCSCSVQFARPAQRGKGTRQIARCSGPWILREQTDLGSRRGQHKLQGLHEPSANIVGGIQPGVLGEYDHPQPRCLLGRGCPPKKSTRHWMRELILNGKQISTARCTGRPTRVWFAWPMQQTRAAARRTTPT